MRPIVAKANEYEKAIQSYLGIKKNSSIKRNIGKKVIRRPSSNNQTSLPQNTTWFEEIKKIEEKEKNIRKNIHELDLKRKKIQKNTISVNSHTKIVKNSEIFDSLRQVNKLINLVLRSSKSNEKVTGPNKNKNS